MHVLPAVITTKDNRCPVRRWYLNNCGCNEHQFEGPMIATIMEGSVKALAEMGWEGLKLDSCSQFNNLSWWNELINATGKPVLLENCHQGGFDPGMNQWQVRLVPARNMS